MNPFKFGSVVSDDFFTNREGEYDLLSQFIASSNHAIMTAPRRFGKASLVNKVVASTNRPVLWLDLQLLTNTGDFAGQLLKQLFKKYPFEKLKFLIRSFRVVPTLSVDTMTNNVEVGFQPRVDSFVHLEDVLHLIEKLGEEKMRPILYKNSTASSTIFSALKRLTQKGILLQTEKYEIDDPFFRKWIINKRS